MKPQLPGGIVLLILGATLLVIGMNASHSQADRWTNFWTGHFTDNTVWYLMAGGLCAAAGVFLTLVGVRGRSA